MWVNWKMRPVETITGVGVGEKMENDGTSEFKYDILKYIVNGTMYPQHNNKIK
jgi:hypothetical protein